MAMLHPTNVFEDMESIRQKVAGELGLSVCCMDLNSMVLTFLCG